MGDGWAWLSLSVLSGNLSSAEVQGLLPGSTASRQNPHLAAVEFKDQGEGTSLQGLLEELAEYLGSHLGDLRASLAGAGFELRIGWSPRAPQECIAIPKAVLAALAELQADILIDAYETTVEIGQPAHGE
jgi:hypothetical protein